MVKINAEKYAAYIGSIAIIEARPAIAPKQQHRITHSWKHTALSKLHNHGEPVSLPLPAGISVEDDRRSIFWLILWFIFCMCSRTGKLPGAS